MSREGEKITAEEIRAWKGRSEGLPALTAYDYPTARFVDEAGVPLILVGDSLGMVVLGYPDTTYVTMEDMLHHVRAAARAQPKALLVADMPIHSYDDEETALRNAERFLEAGAEAVKLEGGREILPQVRALLRRGIPVLGHIGMLPQHIREEGRYRVKGKTEEERGRLLEDAKALAEAGVFALVLELVVPEVAEAITQAVPVPTLGIGSGVGTDGQIRVLHDIVGLFPWFRPKFVRPRAEAGEAIRNGILEWVRAVRERRADV